MNAFTPSPGSSPIQDFSYLEASVKEALSPEGAIETTTEASTPERATSEVENTQLPEDRVKLSEQQALQDNLNDLNSLIESNENVFTEIDQIITETQTATAEESVEIPTEHSTTSREAVTTNRNLVDNHLANVLTDNGSDALAFQEAISSELGLGLGFASSNISLVIDLAFLSSTIKVYQGLNTNIEAKTLALNELEENVRTAQNGVIAGGKSVGEALESIESLKSEVASLKEKKNDLLKDTTISLGLETATLTADILSKAGALTSAVAAGTTAATTLVVIGGVAGRSLSVLGLSLAAYSLVGDRKESKMIEAEVLLLKEKLQSTIDPALRSVIHLRLNHLSKADSENKIKTLQDLTCFGASSTAVVVGVASTSLAIAGVTVGTTVLAATGIGAVAVGAGLVGTGVLYAAYRNREVIQLSLQKKSVSQEEKQLSHLIEKHTQLAAQSEKEIASTKETLERRVGNMTGAEESLVAKRDDLSVKMGQLGQRGDLTTPQKKEGQVYLKGRIKEIDSDITLLQKTRSELVTKETNRKMQLVRQMNISKQIVENASARKIVLSEKTQLLNAQKEITKLKMRFQGLSQENLMEKAQDLQKLLQNETSKDLVKSFLLSEGISKEDFEAQPVAAAFKYAAAKS